MQKYFKLHRTERKAVNIGTEMTMLGENIDNCDVLKILVKKRKKKKAGLETKLSYHQKQAS